MGLHKLTAGDGYMYLIRQVAASDATDRGRPSLADYYSAKGETPGVWMAAAWPRWASQSRVTPPIPWSPATGESSTAHRSARTR